jgi:hypothetical protein
MELRNLRDNVKRTFPKQLRVLRSARNPSGA